MLNVSEYVSITSDMILGNCRLIIFPTIRIIIPRIMGSKYSLSVMYFFRGLNGFTG